MPVRKSLAIAPCRAPTDGQNEHKGRQNTGQAAACQRSGRQKWGNPRSPKPTEGQNPARIPPKFRARRPAPGKIRGAPSKEGQWRGQRHQKRHLPVLFASAGGAPAADLPKLGEAPSQHPFIPRAWPCAVPGRARRRAHAASQRRGRGRSCARARYGCVRPHHRWDSCGAAGPAHG